MKRKKLVAVTAAAVMAFSVTSGVYAATTPMSKDIPVTYDNTVIPDPDNPGTATWGVALPGKIMFSDNSKTVNGLNVTLKGMNGFDIPAGLTVNVSVKSANGFNVKFNDTDVAYSLTYDGGSALSGTGENALTPLTKASPLRTGVATLTGTTTVQGSYTDTLTYKVQKQEAQP